MVFVARILASGLTLIALYSLYTLFSLYRNVRVARDIGIKYVISPVHISNKFWLCFQKLLLPYLDRLPLWMTRSWLPVSVYDRVWRHGYAPFEYHNSTTLIVVSPFKLTLWTCSPRAVVDMTRRRNDLMKPIDELAILNVHGPTVTASEGEQGRRYRKVTTGSFGHHMFEQAWLEGVSKAGILARRLIEGKEHPGRVKKELELVTFAVVSEVCFGISVSEDGEMILQRHTPHRGKMSYWESFAISAEYMGVTFMTPKSILRRSPFEIHQKAYESNREWLAYMEDMVHEKRMQREDGDVPTDPNLLDSLYTASMASKNPLEHEAVLGNIWVFILGGFHTSANTLHFILVLLAMNPLIQRTLQESIDSLTESRNPAGWTHSAEFPKLLNSHVGAVVAETLRCFGVLPWIPKTTGRIAAPLVIDNPTGGTMRAIIPPHTLVLANTSATHRNPDQWPVAHETMEDEPEPFAASGWNPWRWLKNARDTTEQELGGDDIEIESLLTSGWQPGSYIPFSDGVRACIGKRFAQTELCAVLARLMRECTVDLKTEGTGTEHWLKAQREAARKLSENVGITLALELKADVPLVFKARRTEPPI